MWIIRDLAARTATLDFTSSGQDSRSVTQVIADGVILANAVELQSWNDSKVQVLVCEACGTEGCQPGGWLVARDVGDGVALIPAFADMLAIDGGIVEYSPPSYVAALGVPMFPHDRYAELRDICTGLPTVDQLTPLSGNELVRLLQWAAPIGVLGSLPDEIAVNRSLVVACSEGGVVEMTELLSREIEHTRGLDAVSLTELETTPITFYLDGLGSPDWKPLAITRDGAHCLCAGGPYAAVERRPGRH